MHEDYHAPEWPIAMMWGLPALLMSLLHLSCHSSDLLPSPVLRAGCERPVRFIEPPTHTPVDIQKWIVLTLALAPPIVSLSCPAFSTPRYHAWAAGELYIPG